MPRDYGKEQGGREALWASISTGKQTSADNLCFSLSPSHGSYSLVTGCELVTMGSSQGALEMPAPAGHPLLVSSLELAARLTIAQC